MERFVQFPTGDNWTFTWVSPILWKQLNLARYLVLSTWYLVSGTWTQPVLGQDFPTIGPPCGGPMLRIIILIPLPRERKPNSRKKKSRLHWLRPRLTAGYLLTGLCTDRAMHTCSRSSVRGTLY